ncbi:MAG TPA: hypothetical protein VFV81_00115, partial [Verrucomicrobiae bacterium]|nr:hypothetical protein [Verrucomicrobiae bacterium]
SGDFTLNGPATNSGAITVSSGAFLSVNSGLGLGGAGGLVNSPGGTITLANGNGIRSDNGAEYILNQGTINGGGGYIQDVAHFTNAGAIDVSANTLTVNSDLNLQSGSSLNVQFNSASSYGRIVVSGNAALNGQFAVALGAGYNPQVGDTFQPLTYGTFSGGFTATNLPGIVPWQFSYGATAVTVQAQTESITWTNSAGGNWSDPNNWSPNQVPGGSTYGNADDVQITAPGSYTVVMDEGSRSAPYYVHTLTLGSGSDAPVLAITNKWLDAGTLAVGSGAQINSSGSYWFNNWITPLEIQSGGVFDSSGDLFDQNVTVDSGGILAGVNSTNGNGSLAINGALDIPAGEFVLNSNGRATNSGAINISGGGDLVVNNTLALSGAGGIQNFPGGTITLSGGHGISSDNGAEYLANQGTLLSSGGYVLSVANFTNSGAITATTGTLNLDAGLHLNGTGSVNAQLNSTADYGKIAIAGDVALGGAFGVTLNYTPVGGDTFQPLTYGSSSGNFNSLNLPALGVGQTWQTTLGATGLTLRVAQAITWTNTAGGNWSTAANWNPNQVPGQYDDVAITTPGTYTVTMDSATVNLHSLALGAGSGNGTQTLWMSAKTLYVNPCAITSGGILAENGSTFHSVIDVQGGGQLWSTNGTYYGPITVDSGGAMSANSYYAYETFHGSLTVASGGLLTLATGQVLISNDGSLTVAASAEADVEGGCYIQLQGPLTNSGTLNLVGNNGNVSELLVYGGTSYNYQGGIWNLPGGTISLNGVANGYSTISGSGSGDYLINQGAVVVTYPGINIRVSQFDNSAGVVTNLAGVLSLSTLTNTLAGTFYAANGATIQLSGGDGTKPLLPGDPLLLNGPGQFRFISGWLDLPTNTIPNLQLTGGYLELGPSFQ